MKLNYDCVRDVMLAIEDNLEFGNEWTINNLVELLPDYTENEIHYACLKLHEGGYLNALTAQGFGIAPSMIARIQDLTFDGHELLGTIRPQSVYEKTKKKVLKELGSASLSIFSSVASSVAKSMLGL